MEPNTLTEGLFDYRNPAGRNLSDRCAPFAHWVDRSCNAGTFQFLRYHQESPSALGKVHGWGGQPYQGVNLASQDYLGLSRHPSVVQAAVEACMRQGTHSAGSEPMGGGFDDARALKAAIGAFTGHPSVVLFPTGWAAGYGAIKGLMRANDIVVLDALAHDCLQHGARASTANVHFFRHNDVEDLARLLSALRMAADPQAAILVVTESLFSMDSDHPDFRAILAACRQHEAHLLVDVAHDLGMLGPGGRGVLAEQGVLAEVDFLIGSFSKTFACIGGFFASQCEGTMHHVHAYSGSYTFSNFLIPPQVAAIRAALSIVDSSEGEALRRATLANSELLRSLLVEAGLTVLGRPSSMVLPVIGSEGLARLAYRACLEGGLIVNCIEFPACKRGEARFRLQVTPAHSSEQIRLAAGIFIQALKRAAGELKSTETA